MFVSLIFFCFRLSSVSTSFKADLPRFSFATTECNFSTRRSSPFERFVHLVFSFPFLKLTFFFISFNHSLTGILRSQLHRLRRSTSSFCRVRPSWSIQEGQLFDDASLALESQLLAYCLPPFSSLVAITGLQPQLRTRTVHPGRRDDERASTCHHLRILPLDQRSRRVPLQGSSRSSSHRSNQDDERQGVSRRKIDWGFAEGKEGQEGGEGEEEEGGGDGCREGDSGGTLVCWKHQDGRVCAVD